MRITRAADIGLRALMVLAGEPGRRTTIGELSLELGVPERHLGKVVQRLAASGWIETSRGRGGGIQVSDAGRAATAADVLVAVEGARPVVDCGEPMCPLLSRDCRLRHSLESAQAAFLAELAKVSLADLTLASPPVGHSTGRPAGSSPGGRTE